MVIKQNPLKTKLKSPQTPKLKIYYKQKHI